MEYKYESYEDKFARLISPIEKTLKKCPFCGAEAKFGSYSGGTGNYGSYSLVTIYCTNRDCGITIDGGDITWMGLEEALPKYEKVAKKWNKRIGEK